MASRKRSLRASRPARWTVAICAAVLAVAGTIVAAEELRAAADAAERQGLAALYEQPVGALDGPSGSLVRSEALYGVPVETRAWRIMYRSRDLHGNPVLATGVVVTPLGPAPASGRTVVSWGHPTTGTARACAPSLADDPFLGIEGLRLLLDRGYTVVATDYTGLGTAGPNSYLIGTTEGHNVLDAVRAARTIPPAQAGSDVILWGHSQGGQAALFAAQVARDYAPELSIRAVAVAAPAADLTALIKTHLTDVSGVTIGSYAFTAFASIYADRKADLRDILTPEAIAIQPQMNEACLLSHLAQLHAIAQPVVGNFVTKDPTTTAPWDRLLAENSAGGSAFTAPLLVAQGLQDELVQPTDTGRYVARAESLGMNVTYRTVSVGTHTTIAYLALPDLIAFLDRVGA